MGNVGHLGLGCSELLDGEWVGDVTLRESLDCVANPPDPLNNTPTPWLTFPDVPGWSAFDINMAVLGVAGTCSKAGAFGSQPGIHRVRQSLSGPRAAGFCRKEEKLHRDERRSFDYGRSGFEE